MKKFLITTAIVTALFSAVNVYAGSTTLKFDQSNYDVSVGETFDVEVDVTANTGFTSLDCMIEYDPSVIQLVGGGDMALDTLYYEDSFGNPNYFYTDALINTMVKQVPSATDKSYDYKGNGVKTAAQLGMVKLANYVSAADENLMLKKITTTGTLCTLTFRAVGEGETSVKVTNSHIATITPAETWTANTSASVSVKKVSAAPTTAATTTTEATTETTTKSTNNNNGGNGGTSDSNTDATTVEPITEIAPETTTQTYVSETDEPTEDTTIVTFNDIADFPWAVEYINALAQKGVINGYADGSFKPSNNVKRCDFVIMLVRALGIENATDENFTDVDPNAYYADAVAAAKAAGIVNGNGDGTFSPDSFITRQDMMLMAKGALEYKGVELTSDLSVLDRFADNAQISEYAKQGVASMVAAGVVNGTGDNIEPKGNTTRAQAAVIISKVIEKLN